MSLTTLYKIDANDSVRVWHIIAENDVVIIQHGLLNGQLQTESERIEVNKSGRSLDQQIALAMQSRINKQLDKGYCFSVEEALQNKGLNAAGLLRPMLARTIADVNAIDWARCLIQYKYNGHRCMITKKEGRLIAYSRNGKIIDSVDHILKDLMWLPEGKTLDGELYCHGVALQTISSWVRKRQPDSKKLCYIIFDMVSRSPFTERYQWLQEKEIGKSTPNIILAPTFDSVEVRSSIKYKTQEAIDNGYEGLVIRHGNAGYEIGKRSSFLVKVKQSLDAEFCIVGVDKSKDGWAIFECYKVPGRYVGKSIQIPDEDIFRVTAPGTRFDKVAAFTSAENYVGKMLTVEFFEWTKDRKPFHPVAIGVRTSE